MYLHKEDRELLRDIVITVSEPSGIEENIVEKGYYVTMILKELTFRNPDVVFFIKSLSGNSAVFRRY